MNTALPPAPNAWFQLCRSLVPCRQHSHSGSMARGRVGPVACWALSALWTSEETRCPSLGRFESCSSFPSNFVPVWCLSILNAQRGLRWEEKRAVEAAACRRPRTAFGRTSTTPTMTRKWTTGRALTMRAATTTSARATSAKPSSRPSTLVGEPGMFAALRSRARHRFPCSIPRSQHGGPSPWLVECFGPFRSMGSGARRTGSTPVRSVPRPHLLTPTFSGARTTALARSSFKGLHMRQSPETYGEPGASVGGDVPLSVPGTVPSPGRAPYLPVASPRI